MSVFVAYFLLHFSENSVRSCQPSCLLHWKIDQLTCVYMGFEDFQFSADNCIDFYGSIAESLNGLRFYLMPFSSHSLVFSIGFYDIGY